MTSCCNASRIRCPRPRTLTIEDWHRCNSVYATIVPAHPKDGIDTFMMTHACTFMMTYVCTCVWYLSDDLCCTFMMYLYDVPSC